MVKYTKENIIEGIYEKIDTIDGFEGLKVLWKYKLPQYPIEIEQNVLEWLNGEPISDIDYHGESIAKIFKLWNIDESRFISVLLGFIDFKNEGWRNRAATYRYIKMEPDFE